MTSNLFFGSRHCDAYAAALLKGLNITELPIDPFDIAKQLKIDVIEKSLDGFEGCLMPDKQGNIVILLNKSIEYTARKRFTIAHELGHFELPHHINSIYNDSAENIGYGYGKSIQEKEANEFAAELLMPSAHVEEMVKFSDVGFDAIKDISEKCQTSLMSSAFRYVKFSPELCAVVISKNGEIKYYAPSEELKAKGACLETQTPLSRSSIASSFFDSNGKVKQNGEGRDDVYSDTWFSDLDCSEYECFEETMAFEKFDQTVSLVWALPKDNSWD